MGELDEIERRHMAVGLQYQVDCFTIILIESVSVSGHVGDGVFVAVLHPDAGNDGAVDPGFDAVLKERASVPYQAPSLAIVEKLMQFELLYGTLLPNDIFRNVGGVDGFGHRLPFSSKETRLARRRLLGFGRPFDE